MTRIPRRFPWLRRAFPLSLVRRLVAARSRFTEVRKHFIPIEHHSVNTNVYHCSVHKTGSQWLMSLLSDITVFRFSGLSHFHYQSRSKIEGQRVEVRDIARISIPERAIVSPMRIPYDAFARIHKPANFKAFYVVRDPRELIVSWYFSARATHLADGDERVPLTRARKMLATLSLEDGLCYAVDFMIDQGRFAAMLGWVRAATSDSNLLLVRFEDLVGADSRGQFRKVFEFCDIRIPDDELNLLLEAYSFSRLTGRMAGTEDTGSHLRSGTSATWPKYFTNKVDSHFRSRTGSIAEALGY